MTKITIHATIKAPVDKVWNSYNTPKEVVNWNNASEDWHTPKAENDLRIGGKFNYRMEAKDGSAGFDFTGIYTNVKEYEIIEYRMDDEREVKVIFKKHKNETMVEVTFDAEKMNSIELQRNGWQAILDNFKRYVETQ